MHHQDCSKAWSLYVHVPFCERHCPYCDFTVVVTATVPHRRFGAALKEELEERADNWPQHRPASIYFGGGTPSAWDAGELQAFLHAVKRRYGPIDLCEVTVEANPEHVNEHLVHNLRDAGVNRISLGVQSFNDRVASILGRAHDGAAAVRATEIATAAFDHVSVDLIHSVPGQTMDDFDRDIEVAGALKIDHVSAYELAIEPKTSFERRARAGLLQVATESTMVEMDRRSEALRRYGFTRYELSSFSRWDGASRHNQGYWSGRPYLGLGPGAHSFRPVDGGHWIRSWNTRSTRRYLDGQRRGETELIDGPTRALELVMAGLRTARGVAVADIARIDSVGASVLREHARGWSREGYGDWDGTRFRPNRVGFLVSEGLTVAWLQSRDTRRQESG